MRTQYHGGPGTADLAWVGKLQQEVIPHTPQTFCRHHMMLQSVFQLSVQETHCNGMLCWQEVSVLVGAAVNSGGYTLGVSFLRLKH